METSILKTVKHMLGVNEDYNGFDYDIVVAINYAFSVLNQLGVGKEGFRIEDSSSEWGEFADESAFPQLREYVYLKTRLLFDPPSTSFALESINKIISEIEWRANHSAEFCK